MKKFIAPLMTTALIFAGSAAFAEDAPKSDRKPPHDRFKEADENADGFLTKEEMKKGQEKRLDEMFTRTDADKDGKLSQEEMKKGREEMRKKWKERRAAHKEGEAPPPGNE